MNILSLFDGMSCGQVALNRAGIPVSVYYASEIDKHAIKIAQKNYPKTIELGDVVTVRRMAEAGVFGKIDLLIGGSPCQGFSFAGKQLAFDDPRSALFFEYVKTLEALRKANPNIKFLLENVRMKKEHLDVITSFLGVEPILINSALLSAQNRQRYYWCNWDVKQPEDRGILLKDIIEYGVVDRDKSYCVDANYWKGGNLKSYFEKGRRQLVFKEDVENTLNAEFILTSKQFNYMSNRPKSFKNKINPNKTNTLRTGYGTKYGNETYIAEPFITAQRGRNIVEGKRKDYKGAPTEQRLEPKFDGKSNCLTSVQKDNYLTENMVIRKLTPIECERLQTLPDNYTELLDTKKYCLYNNLLTNKWELLCNVQSKIAEEKQTHINSENYVLNIIKDISDLDLPNYLEEKLSEIKNANIVIQKLGKKEVEQEVCAIDITKTGLDTQILCTQIKTELLLVQEGMKKELVVKISTESLWKITLEENLIELKLFIMLIAIKLIIQLRIYTFVETRANIQFYIENLKELQGNLLSVVLSNLEMATTKSLVSNTQRYKMLGNGWTVDVIAHILRSMPV